MLVFSENLACFFLVTSVLKFGLLRYDRRIVCIEDVKNRYHIVSAILAVVSSFSYGFCEIIAKNHCFGQSC